MKRAKALREGSGALTLFGGMSVVNLANFAFSLIMSRLFPTATYGALGSLLSLVGVVGIAAGGVQAAVTQTVAGWRNDAIGHRVAIGRSAIWGAAIGGIAMVGVVAASPAIGSFLHLERTSAVIWLALYLLPAVALLVPQGVLLGQLRFRAVALGNVGGALTRVVAGVVLVDAGFGLSGAIAASTLGAATTLGLLLWPLRFDLAWRSPLGQLRLDLGSTVLSLVSVGGFSLFMGLDTVLARHFLAPVQSGYYVAALTAARIALFLPGAVVTIAFPYFASAYRDSSEAARRHLRTALAIVGILGAGAAAVMSLVPGLVVTSLFGPRYRPAAGVVGILGLSAMMLGLVNLLTYFHLSRRSRCCLTVWAAMLTAGAGIAAFHRGPGAIAWVVVGVDAVTVVALAVPAFARSSRLPRRESLLGA